MSRRRIAAGILAAIGLGLVIALAALVALGAVLESQTRQGVADRIATSLGATATIDRGSLSLVRGALDLEGLAVRRDDAIGHLAIAAAALRCELPPLGLALVDRDCRELAIAGTRLEVSSAALFRMPRSGRPPLHVRRLVIEDAHLEFSPSALLPDLGRVAIDIAHAEAGDTRLVTPLSWLFALRELAATIALPAGITLQVTYGHGELRVAGGPLGSAPIALPIALPVAEPGEDARAELARLAAFATAISTRLIERRAADWLESKVRRR